MRCFPVSIPSVLRNIVLGAAMTALADKIVWCAVGTISQGLGQVKLISCKDDCSSRDEGCDVRMREW